MKNLVDRALKLSHGTKHGTNWTLVTNLLLKNGYSREFMANNMKNLIDKIKNIGIHIEDH